MKTVLFLSLLFVAVLGGSWFQFAAFDFFREDTQSNMPYAVSFVGDVFLGRDVETTITARGNAFSVFASDLESEGVVRVGNFEASAPTNHEQTPNGGFSFSVPASFLPSLKDAGFTHMSLANNHSLDNGYVGLQETIAHLGEAGVETFGTNSTPYTVVEVQGKDIAILGVQMVTKMFNEVAVREQLYEAATKSDLQVVYIHWGEEYELQHSTEQEAVAETLVAAGADLIIGHHPHVVQDIQLIDGVPVVYSLGNYIFDQYFSEAVQEGLRVTLVPQASHFELLLTPVMSKERSTPTPLGQSETTVWLKALAERSAPALSSMIGRGRVTFTSQTLANEERER